jgi:YD repeat-containing protein
MIDQPTGSGITLHEEAGYDYRMGTLTIVKDPNYALGNDTALYATYDVFGRLVTLVKPGDSQAYPTVVIEYFDSLLPVLSMVHRRELSGSGLARPAIMAYDGLGRLIQTKQESKDGAQHIVSDTIYDGLSRPLKQSQPRYVDGTAGFWSYTPHAAVGVMRWTNTSFSYNTIGNIITKSFLTMSYPASGANSVRPHAVSNVSGTGYVGSASSYDANGNLLTGGNRSYSWNADNQPTSITGTDGVVETYAYDAEGTRVRRTPEV